MNINQELELLIEKYNIDRHYPAYRVSKRACDYLRKWVQKLADGKEDILFIGMDDKALKLIQGWGARDSIEILFINNVDELNSHVKDLMTKKIYVASFTRTVEILHWLWKNDFVAESIYDILEKEQIYLQMEFYRFFSPIKVTEELDLHKWISGERTPDGSSITLLEYYYQKRRLAYVTCERDIRIINEKLFFLAICMRNFLEAERLLSIMKNQDGFKQFWDETCQLLFEVKEKLYLRKQKDIIIYWLDALPFKDIKRIKYLDEKSEHSLCFHNAYTVTPWTIPTCRTMFCKMREIDDLGYRVNYINLDNSPVLNDIKENNYQFNNLSPDFIDVFEPQYSHNVGVRWYDTCSEVFWNLIDQILQSEQKTVFLAHVGMETHLPALSVRRDKFDMKHNEVQFDELDMQLRFYNEMLGDGFYRIFMSDHGYCEDAPLNRVHILFQLYYSKWSGREIYKIFSLLDFDKILHQMLIGEEIEDSLWEKDYALVQDIDIYNKELLQTIINAKVSLANYTAYKGLVTEEYLYARFKAGEETLITQSEMDNNTAIVLYAGMSKQNRKLFKKLREKVGEFPKELDIDSKFKYSKYLYIIYENVKKTVGKVAQLLNEKFGAYPDSSIALRMGGEHSYQVYTLLTESVRKKIYAVVDRDDNCKCKNLGIPIIKDIKELPDTVENIILSSFTYLSVLQEEARECYNWLNVIDIYEYLSEHGYKFNSVFWYGLDSDWDVGFPME